MPVLTMPGSCFDLQGHSISNAVALPNTPYISCYWCLIVTRSRSLVSVCKYLTSIGCSEKNVAIMTLTYVLKVYNLACVDHIHYWYIFVLILTYL